MPAQQAQPHRHAPQLHQDVGRHRRGARRRPGVRARRARPGAAHQARLRQPADRAARRPSPQADKFMLGNSSARRSRAGSRSATPRARSRCSLRDSQSNPNRAAEVAKELIVRDKVDLMLVGNTPETTNPVCTQCEIEEVACVSTMAPWQPWFIGQQANPAGGPPAWKPFNYVYHYFWGLEDVIAVFTNMWGQLDTNKSVGGAVPQRRRRQRLGRQAGRLPAGARQAGLQADRSRPLPEPHRQLLGADHRLQERQLRDPHRRGAAARLHHLLEAGAAAGLQAEGGLGRQGDPVPGRGRGARQGRPQSLVGGVVVAEPSVQVVAQRHERQGSWPTPTRPPPRSSGRSRSASSTRCSRWRLDVLKRTTEIGNAKATVEAIRGHQPRHRGRQGRMERRRRAAVRGQERHQDAAGRRPVARQGRQQVRHRHHRQQDGARRSPSAARWNRSPECAYLRRGRAQTRPRASIVRCCSRSARLSRSFGSLKAADGIDLVVARGEAVGIIGPNGAGKTTLFNLIAGNLDADAGEIRLDGVDITRTKRARALHRRHRPLLPDPAPVREPDRVREPAGGGRARRAAAQVRRRRRFLRRHPGAHRPHAARQHAGRHADAARAQAAGDGARARHRARSCCCSTRSPAG